MLIVGFDLDMTLVDSRPGIRKSMIALSQESGVHIDADLVIARLGPKLEAELAHWFPPGDVPDAAEAFRRHYWETCVGGTHLLKGARASLDVVRAANAKTAVITGKVEPLAWRCLRAVGLHKNVDIMVGYVQGDEKRDALRAHAVDIYVGDTIADVRAAVDAGVTAVGVATGMHNVQQLTDAGATVTFETLDEFPGWLAST